MKKGVSIASSPAPVADLSKPAGCRLLSLKAAGDYLSISFWAVRTLIWNGQLASVRMGRRVLVDVRDLDAWIEKNKERLEYPHDKTR